MQAACVAGGADARIQAALNAGCDMGLVCNDRTAACTALDGIQTWLYQINNVLERMRGKIPKSIFIKWQAVKTAIEDLNSI
jgi:beta-N-acetylhexosaminidase